MEISAHIDWLSVTNKNMDTQTVYTYLLDEPYEPIMARMGYTLARRFVQGVIEMSNPDRPDMGTHAIYSAQALRVMETELNRPPMEILKFHIRKEHRIARLDLAIDIHDSGLDIRGLFRQFEDGSCVTRTSKGSLVSGANGDGDTLYVGSQKKRTKMLRVYDKAKERKVDGDWKRIEIELKGILAHKAASVLVQSDNVGQSIAGMVKAFAHFPMDKVWCSVIDAREIPITKINRKSSNTELWLLKQCAPALAKAVLANPDFMNAFVESVEDKIKRMKSGALHD